MEWNQLKLCIFIILLLCLPTVTAESNYTGKDPNDIFNTFGGWFSEWFWNIVGIAITLSAILYVWGAEDSENRARAIQIVKGIIVAVVIYYVMPWIVGAL